MLADFQICTSVPLKSLNKRSTIKEEFVSFFIIFLYIECLLIIQNNIGILV